MGKRRCKVGEGGQAKAKWASSEGDGLDWPMVRELESVAELDFVQIWGPGVLTLQRSETVCATMHGIEAC
jgi:hypothetical protein